MKFDPKRFSRAARSGQLAEAFCEHEFGIVEGDEYEIKGSAWRSYQVVLRTIQLIASMRKQFVIVRYRRGVRRLTRGPRKGREVFTDTIEQAYKKEKWVYAVPGADLIRIIVRERLPLLLTKIENDFDWAPYWTVPIRCLPDDVLLERDGLTVYGNPLDPPGFLNGSDDVPF